MGRNKSSSYRGSRSRWRWVQVQEKWSGRPRGWHFWLGNSLKRCKSLIKRAKLIQVIMEGNLVSLQAEELNTGNLQHLKWFFSLHELSKFASPFILFTCIALVAVATCISHGHNLHHQQTTMSCNLAAHPRYGSYNCNTQGGSLKYSRAYDLVLLNLTSKGG